MCSLISMDFSQAIWFDTSISISKVCLKSLDCKKVYESALMFTQIHPDNRVGNIWKLLKPVTKI